MKYLMILNRKSFIKDSNPSANQKPKQNQKPKYIHFINSIIQSEQEQQRQNFKSMNDSLLQ
jgi:hypothetical protein